ncbi:MAG: hypothetical protein AAF320_04370 [Myxococcota bacterium]
MSEHDVLQQLLYTGGSVLLGLAGVGIKSLTSAWASKVRNQTLAQIIRNTDDVVMHVVKSIYQTHVKPRTRNHRELSPQQGRRIRQIALQQIKQHLGRQTLRDLHQSFGDDVDVVLQHHLEAAVQDLKHERHAHKQVASIADQPQHPLDSCPAVVSPQQEAFARQQANALKQFHQQAQARSNKP